MTNSTCSLSIAGKPVSLTVGHKTVSRSVGAVGVLNYFSKTGVMNRIAAVLDNFLPRPRGRFEYTNIDYVRLIQTMLIMGMPDFNDTDELRQDALVLMSTLVCSDSTLSRFFGSLQNACEVLQARPLQNDGVKLEDLEKPDPRRVRTPIIDALNELLLKTAVEQLSATSNPEYVVFDVDSTPIQTYGKQGETAYDHHYHVKGYLPIFGTINGIPALVQNAPGATYGAALMLQHAERVVKKLQASFPNATIIFRADTGFANNELLDLLNRLGCRYVVGCNHNGCKPIQPAVMKALSEVRAVHPERFPQAFHDFFELQFDKPLPEVDPVDRPQEGFRCCGCVEYAAKSWNHERLIAFRLQFDPKYKNANLRCVQTNMTEAELLGFTKGRGQRKERSLPVELFEGTGLRAELAVELYEAAFSDRGTDERSNQEWKEQCFASCVSCSGFFANSIRMIFAAFFYQMMEKTRRNLLSFLLARSPQRIRRSIKPNLTRSHKAEKLLTGPLIRTFREQLINRPAHFIKHKDGSLSIKMGYLRSEFEIALRYLLSL